MTNPQDQGSRPRPGRARIERFRVGIPSAILMVLLGITGRAEQINDATYHFTMTIPEGFERATQFPPGKPKWLYAFTKKEADGTPVGIIVERMGAVIGREHLNVGDMPPGFRGRLHRLSWRGFEIDAIENPEELNGVALVTIKAQVPLKPEALQVSVVAPAERRDESLALVNRLLGGLTGESNWLDSSAPASLANSPHYGMILIVLSVIGGIAGFAVLYLVSRVAPRGTLAILGAALILSNLLVPHTRNREVAAMMAAMALMGVLSIVSGAADYFREPARKKNKNKKKRKKTQGQSSSQRAGQPTTNPAARPPRPPGGPNPPRAF